jgi:hypothetical protein
MNFKFEFMMKSHFEATIGKLKISISPSTKLPILNNN